MERARVSFPARWEDGGVLVVDVVGEFDEGAAAELCGLLTRMARTGQQVFVVDFTGAERCDIGAARAFVRASLEAEAMSGDGFLAVVASAVVRSALYTAAADCLSGGVHGSVTDAVEAYWAPEGLGERAS
ncbi:STAS domain-containing protein [Streptomyces sp. cg35]|uniref:STAS domain-containing protein n=1 Tax=Streptomyces sp. cg35 TaxID=3421650 RepID=UPI003D1799FC